MGDAERFEILRPLGADQATFVARDTTSTAPRFFVIERVTRTSPVPAARAELLRRGRALVALEHPKVVRVREVYERDGEVLVASDYVDGEWLASLMMMKPRPPLQVMVRLLLDVLEGLSALHDLRDDKGQLIGFVHGALGPDTVLVAEDGVAEIARACRLPRPGANERYVAPELRRSDEPIDVRCDVYAAGAILRDLLVDAPGDAVWAEPLTDIAWRACSVDPENRWASASAMATTVRRIVGNKLAPASVVADFMRSRFSARMQSRRVAFEMGPTDSVPPPSSGEPLSVKPSDMEVIDPALHASMVETLPPPPMKKEPIGRISLAKRPAGLDDTPEPPEPDTQRRLGQTTEPGLSKPQGPRPEPPPPAASLRLPPPVASRGAPAASRPSSLSQQAATGTLPPPDVVITPEPLPPPPPPPTILPSDDPPTESYRRQLPTFPTWEQEPPRRRAALQGIFVAAGMLLTFGVGWWVGRTYAPVPEVAERACPSTTVAAATAPASASPAGPGAAGASTGSAAASTGSAAASASGAASAVASTAPAPSSGAAAGASTAVASFPGAVATTATTAPTFGVPATTHAAVPAWTAPATTATVPRVTPAATAPAVATAPAATTAAPKPAPSGGYVPTEL
jgi:hypothetical protein